MATCSARRARSSRSSASLAIKHGLVPPTIKSDNPDGLEVDFGPACRAEKNIKIALNNSFAWRAQRDALAIRISSRRQVHRCCRPTSCLTKQSCCTRTRCLQDDGLLQEPAPELEPEYRGVPGLRFRLHRLTRGVC